MRVKRYVVDEVPEALPIIRSELGKDAVILNTKEIYVGGFLGLFRKKKMEVIAAVETNASDVRNIPHSPLPSLAKPSGASAGRGAAAAAGVPTVPALVPVTVPVIPVTVPAPPAARRPGRSRARARRGR